MWGGGGSGTHDRWDKTNPLLHFQTIPAQQTCKIWHTLQGICVILLRIIFYQFTLSVKIKDIKKVFFRWKRSVTKFLPISVPEWQRGAIHLQHPGVCWQTRSHTHRALRAWCRGSGDGASRRLRQTPRGERAQFVLRPILLHTGLSGQVPHPYDKYSNGNWWLATMWIAFSLT